MVHFCIRNYTKGILHPLIKGVSKLPTVLQLLIVTVCSVQHVAAQTFRINALGPGEGWRFELKTGTGALLTEIPEKYLEKVNNVNIPTGRLGMAAQFSVKKMSMGHFALGYQFDYMRIHGEVLPAKIPGSAEKVEVLTQGIGHNIVLAWYLKKREDENKFNFSLYYKMGGLSLDNQPLDEGGTEYIKKNFLANVALITGWGAGIYYKHNRRVRFVLNAELNRTGDLARDIFQFYNVFLDSPNTVNKYLNITAGVNFELNFEFKKKKVKSHLPFRPPP